jgi:hypothetical protein
VTRPTTDVRIFQVRTEPGNAGVPPAARAARGDARAATIYGTNSIRAGGTPALPGIAESRRAAISARRTPRSCAASLPSCARPGPQAA